MVTLLTVIVGGLTITAIVAAASYSGDSGAAASTPYRATPTPTRSTAQMTGITAKYVGSTNAGFSVTSANSFSVTAQFADGTTGGVPSDATVTLTNPGTLGDGTTTTFVLDAGGHTCSVDVTGRHVATAEEKNALYKAQTYASTMHMSKRGVYDQLTSEYGEGFPASAAQYAVDNVQADWNANALYKARSYQSTMHMSRSRIYEQLTSEYGEQFTVDEARYAIDHLDQ